MTLAGVFTAIRDGAAAVTDALAHVGERVTSASFTVGAATITVQPRPPEAPLTCPTCGKVK